MKEREATRSDFEVLAGTFGLPAEELEAALRSQKACSYDGGEAMVSEGEYGTNVYVLLKGAASVRRSRWVSGGPVAKLGPGDIFGEKAFFSSSTRSASVAAEGPCEALCICAAAFQGLLDRHPGLESKVRELARLRLSQLLH